VPRPMVMGRPPSEAVERVVQDSDGLRVRVEEEVGVDIEVWGGVESPLEEVVSVFENAG
jgi:hypothetical protein